MGALTEVVRDMGREWKMKLLTFVGGTCGSVHKEHLKKNLEELQVLKSKWKGIRKGLVRRLLEEQLLRTRFSGVTMQRSGEDKRSRAQGETGQMHLGGDVCVICRDIGGSENKK